MGLTRGRGDADEASDHSLYSSDDRTFLVDDHIKANPNNEASGGAYMGVKNCE